MFKVNKKIKRFIVNYRFESVLLVIAILFSYAAYENYFVINERYASVVHGPHLGYSLDQISKSDQTWADLAAVTRSRFQTRKSRTSTITNVSTTTTKTTTTISAATAPTAPANTTIQNAQTVAATGLPYGIAAGGGLTYLGQSDLDTYFSGLKDLGVTWVRWDIDWSRVQPKDASTYDWSQIDLVAYSAKKYGIKSLAIITYAPDWAEVSSCPTSKRCPPSDPDKFAAFASVVATRYKGVINAYEVWNEENYAPFWYPSANPQEYITLLEATYYQIKSADSSAIVLSGGLAPTADGGGNVSPATFVNAFYSSNAHNYFDALAFHPYSYPVSPDYSASWSGWQQMYVVHDIMALSGDNKKIWVTEYGAPTGGPGTMKTIDQLTFKYGSDYMNESAQGAMAQRSAELYSQNKSWLGGFFWYGLRDDGTSNTDPENFFGLLRYDGSKKPAYDIIKNIIPTI